MSTRSACVALCLVVATTGIHAQSTVLELNEAGWKMLQNGEGARAARLFAEALTIKPNDPVLLFGAGAAAHLDGRPKEAIARLRRALDLSPRLTGASHLLGLIAYAEGDVALAIAVYEKALTYAPNDPQLTSRLASWRKEADTHRDFEERQFDRFRVMFQGRADAPLALQATEVLTAAFWQIGAALGAYPSDTVVVTLYTEQQFRDITQAPEWAGGLYDGRIRVPAAGAARTPQSFERVLVHELTHAMVAHLAPRGIPAWLHEGLAQHFEGDDPKAAQRRLKAGGRTLSLRSLEGSFSRLGAADAHVAYDESLVAVDRIFQRPGFNWPSLFRALAENDRTEHTFDNFGFRYSDLEAEFGRY
ncbi:MAG TPA: tetratricopeptide repeat protein [Vicinamibacterales bacterium]